MLLFSGTSNQPLAEKIAEELKISLASSEIVRFADGEVRVRLLDDVKDEHMVVVQSLSQPGDSNLMELCQFAEIGKRKKAKKITAVIPYLAYARQHRAHREGETIAVKLVANFLKTAGFNEVMLLDLHEEEALNYFKIPTLHLSAVETFSKYIDEHRDDFGGDDLIIVAPDRGRQKAAENLASALEVNSATVEKTRPLDQTDTVKECQLIGDVKNKEVIIYDDMISTGSTMLMAASCCLSQGAFRANLMATHGVFSHLEKNFWQNSAVEKIFVTDSVLVAENKRFEKLEIISIAPLIARNLLNFV
ncbi:ribose-phosphate pyrophosphokinase [Candidatus Gottesmanbacteria bacterium]|nr:ribose-phosphate pyrophosphokinase [Candidatus Gottesmanbacteria bacterium]